MGRYKVYRSLCPKMWVSERSTDPSVQRSKQVKGLQIPLSKEVSEWKVYRSLCPKEWVCTCAMITGPSLLVHCTRSMPLLLGVDLQVKTGISVWPVTGYHSILDFMPGIYFGTFTSRRLQGLFLCIENVFFCVMLPIMLSCHSKIGVKLLLFVFCWLYTAY